MPNKLTENTYVSISLLIMLIGAIWFLGTAYGEIQLNVKDIKVNAQDIKEMRQDMKCIKEQLTTISVDIAVIKDHILE